MLEHPQSELILLVTTQVPTTQILKSIFNNTQYWISLHTNKMPKTRVILKSINFVYMLVKTIN